MQPPTPQLHVSCLGTRTREEEVLSANAEQWVQSFLPSLNRYWVPTICQALLQEQSVQ